MTDSHDILYLIEIFFLKWSQNLGLVVIIYEHQNKEVH